MVDVGVVVIGRNEGARLVRCLESLPLGVACVVYVDSGSTDRSVEEAARHGGVVVELDRAIPFTAARARNAGLCRLRKEWPKVQFVQLIDGDCVLAPTWIEDALETLVEDPGLAIVCGRRREAAPESSIYNRLCDMEWDTPIGETSSCGGDALARLSTLASVGDFDANLIAGEEPELCARLRARGWRIQRLNREMTRHDAAMYRFSQWWRRTIRSGHARAEVAMMHPPMWRRELRSILGWGLALPAMAGLAALLNPLLSAPLLMAYPALGLRIMLRRMGRGERKAHAALYAASCIIGKFAALIGVVQFALSQRRGHRMALIEYK